jgi:predicted O-methyltransferase YrrM
VEHYFQDDSKFTDNWFSYFHLYLNMVQRFPSGSKFVEIGAWEGRSTVAMAVEIINSGKQIEFTAIDTFGGSEEHVSRQEIVQNTLYQKYKENIKPVENVVRTVVSDSVKAAEQFENNSIDFIFIDGDHSYEGVKRDILAYLPKMKVGGVMAGHDFNEFFPGVVRAVDEIFGKGNFSPWYQYGDKCWYFEIRCKYLTGVYDVH